MGRYFGTDGIRGAANLTLTPELCLRFGKALATLPAEQIVLAMDTRQSNMLLAGALISGALSQNVSILHAGILPTPGLAYYCRTHQCSGVMITASHNPYPDNGLKLFKNGRKLLAPEEAAFEDALDATPPAYQATIGTYVATTQVRDEYLAFLRTHAPKSQQRIGLDCAHGATYEVAAMIYQEVSPHVFLAASQPTGTNINEGCGATHMECIQALVRDQQLDLGFSFDGDGDRFLCVDAQGVLYDGDAILAILARYLRKHGQLANDTLVVTKMSNLGILNQLRQEGIRIIETDIGDKYVLETLEQQELSLGGEQSGHIIWRDALNTGDGILASLLLLRVLEEEQKTLAELTRNLVRYPERLVNLAVPNKSIATHPSVQNMVHQLQQKYGERGKFLVRASGTEALVRVSASAPTTADVDAAIATLVHLIRSLSIGTPKEVRP